MESVIYNCLTGEETIVAISDEEINTMRAEAREAKHREQIRPRTLFEGMAELNRAILFEKLAETDDKTLAIACMAFFEPWTPGQYSAGDIRTDPQTGYPRECILAHNSTVNPDWTIATATLWKPYHSRKKEYALPWEAPTGVHDMYRGGEYMLWTDYGIYKCLNDTNFSPLENPSAWESVKE